jgi:hypothetical protein
MKRLLPSTFLALIVLSVLSLPAAETKSVPPAAVGKTATSPALAGEYTGNWKGRDETTGAFRLKLRQDGAAWVAEAWFTFEGNEIATKMKSVEIDGSKVEMVFAWEVQGTAAQSKLSGEWTGEALEGKYENTSQEGPASGTWKLTKS